MTSRWVFFSFPFFFPPAALVTFIDAYIGQVVQTLKDEGLFDNTLIILQSDNGGPINGGSNNYPCVSEACFGLPYHFHPCYVIFCCPLGSEAASFRSGKVVNELLEPLLAAFSPNRSVGRLERTCEWCCVVVSLFAFPSSSCIRVVSSLIPTPPPSVASWDWYSTFCNLAGVDPADPVAAAAGLPAPDSINVWDYISGASNKSERTRLVMSSNQGGDHNRTRGETVIGGIIRPPYKLVIG